jgi:predicted nucleotidyltransferase
MNQQKLLLPIQINPISEITQGSETSPVIKAYQILKILIVNKYKMIQYYIKQTKKTAWNWPIAITVIQI